MHVPPTRRWTRCLIATILGIAACGVVATSAAATYDPADPAQKAAYDHAYDVGTQAYVFGFPLLDGDGIFRSTTSLSAADGRGRGPVNQFNHFAKLADAADRSVVAPNSDTLYSMAMLDLRRQPQVLHTVKGTKRFHVLPLMSPYDEDFANIGSPPGSHPDGDYLVTGPGWRGTTPKGLTRIRSPYDHVWILGRTYNAGKQDLAATKAVMRGYRLTPLNRWNPRKPYGYTPPPPKQRDVTPNVYTIPGTQPGENPLAFLDELNRKLKEFPPTARDAPAVAKLATMGIGPGLPPVSVSPLLSEAQKAGLAASVTDGPGLLQRNLVQTYLDGFDQHNGWLVTKIGTYGTDYMLRAIVEKVGVGAPTPNVSMYPVALLDRDRAPLTGARRYVAHFPPRFAKPPVRFFWSMTMYDTAGFFVINPANTWLVNDRSGLKRNADGSMDIYLQGDAPADPVQRVNWLPTPTATAAVPTFQLIFRLYGLSSAGIQGVASGKGWQAPTILPCQADGRTREGVACAR